MQIQKWDFLIEDLTCQFYMVKRKLQKYICWMNYNEIGSSRKWLKKEIRINIIHQIRILEFWTP